MTSWTVSLGPGSLSQLGVSLSDIALVINIGQRIGNFFRVANNEASLFEALNEDNEALLKRRGLVDPVVMRSRWANLQFIHEGTRRSSPKSDLQSEQDLSAFSWLMVVVVTALDLCLSPGRVRDVLVNVLATVLERKNEVEERLRIMIPINIESWRSVGQVRRISISVGKRYTAARKEFAYGEAIPQLNPNEEEEMVDFLVWLLRDNPETFVAYSLDVFAFAAAISSTGLHLRTKGPRRYDSEPLIEYHHKSNPFLSQHILVNPVQLEAFGGAQQISYRCGTPQDMIQSIRAERDVLNRLESLWNEGTISAKCFEVDASSQYPFGPGSDIYYQVRGKDRTHKKFDSRVIRLQETSFPVSSHKLLCAIERLTEGMKAAEFQWLEQHVQVEYLRKTKITDGTPESMKALLAYQALVFGFYYELIKPLLKFDQVNPDSYFQGIWGVGSNRLLRICMEMSDSLRREQGASRAQVLYMLSSMFNGRQKPYTEGSSRHGLVGILGSISVVTMSLIRAVDTPKEIAQFVLLDLPIIELAPETDGEIYAATGSGIQFDSAPIPEKVVALSNPKKAWTVHAKMGVQFEGTPSGVVMAARCAGRLVGWFNPLAADVLFLSEAYCSQDRAPTDDDLGSWTVNAVEVTDEHWQKGCVPRPVRPETADGFVLVQSRGCAVLRYAAAGFFGGVGDGIGDEVAISSGNIDAAFGRVEAQESGVLIA